jgi:TonB-dependent starch-binding outer membrane protein SusC
MAIQAKDLHWQSNLSVSRNQTIFAATFPKINDFDNPNQLRLGSVGSPGYCCGNVQVIENQQPIGQFYTLQSEGINANGQWKNRDLNNDGVVNERDQTRTGNAQPALLLGWDNTLNWKRFSINVFWRGVLGHDQMNIFHLFYANPSNLSSTSQNILEVALSGDFARLNAPFNPLSDYFIENSSFLRLENLSLGYDLPIANPQKKRKLHLYLSTQNLLTLTGFSGNDAEPRLINQNSPLIPGMVNANHWHLSRGLSWVDRGRYPLTRSLVLGARVKL